MFHTDNYVLQFNSKYLVTLVVKWIDHDRSKYQIKKRNVDTKSATLSQYQDIEVANNAQILDVRLCLSSGDYLAIMTKEGSISSLNKIFATLLDFKKYY